ncbi:MAG TPA: hypothetical protein VIM99_16910 [Blastocatellia bacterium]
MIKPFSIKNVTQHMLYSARSFRFALPAQVRDKFDHANYLAVNLSSSLFEADEGIRDFTKGITADLAFGPIGVQPLEEVNKSAIRQKLCPKKSAPAKRAPKHEKRNSADPLILSNLVALAHLNEVRLAALSPARVAEANYSQFSQFCPTKPSPARAKAAAPVRSIESALTLRKRDCEKRETDQRVTVTWVADETGAPNGVWVVEKSGLRKINIQITEPEDQEIEATAEDVKEEMMRAEPVPTRTVAEPKASMPSSPFAKCAKDWQ